jgi:hypothetical protein
MTTTKMLRTTVFSTVACLAMTACDSCENDDCTASSDCPASFACFNHTCVAYNGGDGGNGGNGGANQVCGNGVLEAGEVCDDG